MKLIIPVALGTLLSVSVFSHAATAASSDVAGSAAPQETADANTAAPDPERASDRLVCRTEKVLGTRRTKRVCRSDESLKNHKEAGRAFTEKGQNRLQDVTGGN
ncbi:hypothetical protein ACFFGH_04685 [Lysobacter korlensis]|uniref:PsiF repeat-containing protein n=1 Tax=Lysobacter korlensis TaxID=553636 RepID=A0ABV6RJI5_9GAMM